MPADLVAFDLETTGLSPRSDRIIEIGAVRFDRSGAVLERLELLVDPGMPVPVAVQRLTGLRQADLRGGLSADEAVAQLADLCTDAELVAHGAPFDLAHCAAVLPAVFAARRCIDTLELARIVVPGARSHSLSGLCAELGIVHARPHRALPDAEATRELLARLLERAAALPAATLATMRALLAPRRTVLRTVFTELVGGDGDPARPQTRGAAAAARRDRRALEQGPPAGARPSLSEAAAAALSPGGPLERAVPQFELRVAQVEMARAVAQTLERSGRLVVEAGTGTGKSIAYLAPLLLWAERSGRRAVVATHTITLQEQLAEHDLPLLAAALGVDVVAAVAKGRQHYISLRRWHRFLARVGAGGHDTDIEGLRFALRVLCWLAETETGDRAELRLSSIEEEWWRRVMSDAGDCLGGACENWHSQRCFMVAARRRANEADVVVANHALVVADAERQGQVLSGYGALVVDEAQHLADVATRQLGTRLRAADVAALLDAARLPVAAGTELEARVARAADAVQRLFGDLRGHIVQAAGLEHPSNVTLALDGHEGPTLEVVRRHARQAVTELRAAAGALRNEATTPALLRATLLPQPDAAAEEMALVADELDDAAGAIDRILGGLRAGDGHRAEGRSRDDGAAGGYAGGAAGVPARVAWLELRAEQAELHEAPVSVDERLRETLFDRVDTAVLTSATLAVGGSLDFVVARTGFGPAAQTLELSSPFDFLRQALAVLVTDMPAYDAPEYDASLARLVEDCASRLGGRTLVLFTGYAPLRSCRGLLGARLETRGIAVLAQGLDGTRRQVLESFVANPRTVLLGTGALWEGVDIPGGALRCVVVAKLPFPVPTDPLVQARSALLAEPFRQLLLPTAVLRLKQGFGRLIRHGDDRGAVVLCDTRLLERDYGQTFLDALPEAAAVRGPASGAAELVERFVADGTVPPTARTAASVGSAPEAEWDPA